MGKEIKFRAWDKRKRVMFTNPFNGVIGGMNDIFANTGDWIYMQYSGKEDKNDTEMYEGDIVIHSSDTKVEVRTGKIWQGKSFEVGEIVYNPEDTRYEVTVRKQQESRYDQVMPYPRPLRYLSWTVIGNIYANKELLKEHAEEGDI